MQLNRLSRTVLVDVQLRNLRISLNVLCSTVAQDALSLVDVTPIVVNWSPCTSDTHYVL